MYKSPNKPIQPNLLKSPQRLASPSVKRVKQKYQTLSHNKNTQITENADKDPLNQCPNAQTEDKNVSNGKKHSDSSLKGCVRDERRSERVQRREQQKKYPQNQTKIKSQWNKNHESMKKMTSQRKENEEQKNMQKIQKSQNINRKEDFKRISQQHIVLKQQTKDEKNCLYPRSEIKIIVQQEQKQKYKQQVSEVSAENQSIINNMPESSNQSQLYKVTQNGQNINHQCFSNQNQQNLLNQLQQACYQNYIIKSMPNLPSFEISQVSTYDKLVNFIKEYLSNYECQLHKYNTFSDSQTKRKFDLICLDCDLLLCDYCVLFGNGEPNVQGQLNGHQQHKIHKLMKLQQLLQRIKTIQEKYHKIRSDLTQMNKKYYSTQNKEVVDEQLIQSSDQINFSMDINANSFMKHEMMHKYPEKQTDIIQNLIRRQKNEKKLQIEEKYHKLLTKLVESKEEAYKNIQKNYSNIKQEANNKIKINKVNFRKFQERLTQMVNFIGQCLTRVNNILDVNSNKNLDQDYKSRIQKTVKIIFKSKGSLKMSIAETLERLELELKKYSEQDKEFKQRDQIKIFIKNALKISYNSYIQQNMDTYVTVDTIFNRNFNKLQILDEESQIQYKTPHKKQQDYNYKSDGFKSMVFQNNQSKIKKEQESKVGNLSIDSEYKQNEFIINFHGAKNSLQRAKSDKNLFKSLELIPPPIQNRKENINIQMKKMNSPKKQMSKELQRIKSQQKTKQTIMNRPIEKKEINKKLISQQIGSLSILSKQNENKNTKNHADITQKSFLSKSRMISDTEKQLEKQIKIKNVIDEYCEQFEKNQDQNNKKMNKLLDLSYLELNNTELQLILSQIYTKLFKTGNNKIALNVAMSSTNIVNVPQTKPKLFSFIKLSDNKITTEGFISIASYLTSASNINISNNMLDLGVLDYIIKNKDKFAPLRIINLKGNFITPFTNANKKQTFLHKKIKEKVSVLGKMGILVHV